MSILALWPSLIAIASCGYEMNSRAAPATTLPAMTQAPPSSAGETLQKKVPGDCPSAAQKKGDSNRGMPDF